MVGTLSMSAMMALEPTIDEQEVLAETYRRSAAEAMTASERRTEVVLAIWWVLVVACIWRLHPPHAFALLPAACSLLVLVLATRVEIDTPFGFTVPTQLGFVPLLFAVPLALVPIAVMLGLVLARLPDVLAGRSRPRRLFLAFGNSWFAIGPVVVFSLANLEPRDAGPAVLIAALGAQIVVDFVASGLRFGAGRDVTLKSQLSETWVYAIDVALSGIALVVAEDIHAHPVAALAPLPVIAVLGVLARERRQRMQSLVELNSAYRGTALVLGDVIEADDDYTGIHSKSVVGLALAVAGRLCLGTKQRRNLEFAALLHDIGKIAIPKEIINKPGALNPDEWSIVRTHTVEGQKILDRIGGFMREVGLIVRSHHERWDGTGYPDGLAGEAIPLEARIIACCDSWNAMRTDRPYREALSTEAALNELQVNGGRQFDPRIVDALTGVVAPPESHAAEAARATNGGGVATELIPG